MKIYYVRFVGELFLQAKNKREAEQLAEQKLRNAEVQYQLRGAFVTDTIQENTSSSNEPPEY